MILAVGAHLDDVEIGVGGILLAHRAKGHEVATLTLSGSSAGGNVTASAREGERAACGMGAQLTVASLPDIIEQIEQAVARFRPGVIYTHSLHDMDRDHRLVHQATIVAAEQVPQVACYQSPSATLDFHPNRFVPIDDFVEDKLAAIAGHRSQIALADYLAPDLLAATARYWSRYSGSLAAEALEMV